MVIFIVIFIVLSSEVILSELGLKRCPSEVFLGKDVQKKCSKFTGIVVSMKLLYNFIEIVLRHGCSPVNLLHIFRTPFPKEYRWRAASVPLTHNKKKTKKNVAHYF